MMIQELYGLPWEDILTRALHIVTSVFLAILVAGIALTAAYAAAESVRDRLARFAAWYRRTPKAIVLAVLAGFALATEVGGSKGTTNGLQNQEAPPQTPSVTLPQVAETRLTRQTPAVVMPSYLMLPQPEDFIPPERYTNMLSRAQYDACFALTSVTNVIHDFEVPQGAEETDYVTSYGVHDAAYWIALPSGFNAGGLEDQSRSVSAVCAAPSGLLLLDALPGRPEPSEPIFAGAETNRLLSVLQTPSGLLPPEGRLWSAPATNGAHLVTWRNLMLGRLAEAKADLQCELYPNGDFTYFIHAYSNADLSAVTNWLVAAQDAGGGEAYAFATNDPLSSAVSTDGSTLALRWTAFGRLDPSVPDTDGDELTDWEELMVYHTSVRKWDTDNDGLSDGEEVLRYGTDPLKPDSLGDGTNDFWRVVDPSSLTNTPWMEGGDGLALLTLETRLDGVESGLAALRIGDTLVPVIPGTSRVCRVAFPCNVNVPFALIFAPGSEGASVSISAIDSEGPVVFNDPGGVFTLPTEPAARGFWAMSTLTSLEPNGISGTLHGVKYRLYTTPLCPHTGRGTLSISTDGLPKDARDAGITGVGFGPMTGSLPATRTVTVDQVRVAAEAQGMTAPGPHMVAFPVEISVAVLPGKTVLNPTVTNAVPAHYCAFESGPDENDPPPQPDECTCPTCLNQICPCRECWWWPDCQCEECMNPYYVDAPVDPNGNPRATENRAHRLLLIGGAPDKVFARPQSADGSSSTGKCSYCQCQQYSSPSCDLPAWTWRLTSGLAVSPTSLTTNGVFSVTGVSPSEAVGGDVFTWKAGPNYNRGKYTVAGLGVVFPNAVPDTAPRVQLGHTNDLLVTTQIPTNNTGTISFSGYTSGADISVKNRQTGQYDTLLSSYAAATWRAAYLSAEQTAELRYAATAAGQYGFTVKYELSGMTPSCVTNTLAFEAIRIQSEPVTSELATGGFVYNPSGIPLGADDRFKIAIVDGTVPSADITWTVTSGAGNVSFVNDYNTGPDIAIHADSVGNFTLEADVKGLVITPPNIRPCFSGKVLPAVTVPVSVFIVRNTDNNPIRNPTTIPALLVDANKVLRQRGITLVQNGDIHILNETNWLDHTDALAQTNDVIDTMMDSTNSLGQAVELYFVRSLESPALKGACRSKGIAIASDGDSVTIAHEVLHTCILEDIYTVDDQEIPGLVSQDRIPCDWGGGYYTSDLTQRALVGRLIMRSGGEEGIDTAPRRDLPSGTIYGWKLINPADASSPKTLGQASVGQSSIQQTPRNY
ncbi:MAG: hypothetical protein WCP12_16985 [bacterium]